MVKINKKLKRIRLGKNQKKIALFLLGGLSLGLSNNPRKSFEIVSEMYDEFKNFDKNELKRSIKSLYESNVIDCKENSDGTTTIFLSNSGKKKVITYSIDNLEIKKPKKWDGKWRFVLFDIPETQKRLRRVLGGHLKILGFFEFQKSVFAHPYDCKDEIDYMIEHHEAREFVRFIVADSVDNELHLKTFFNLLSKEDK
ncbi:hypothetical protein KKG48_00550 [Patescibacteria group bacterium]|nr:hypothetical protein [Patescibacteria group bacterium]MCG2695125.1 hypothetical protein [Candidatus Parcubacteria bacterium]